MAFGFSPKFISEFPLEDLSEHHFLSLALEAAKTLDWNIGYKSETGFIAFTGFSMSSWSEEIKVTIYDEIAVIKSECTGNQLFDWGKNKRNVENLISGIEELKLSLTQEEIERKYEAIKPGLVSREDDELSKPPSTTKEKFTNLLSIFKPTDGYFVTPIIIDINIAIFIIMVISGVSFIEPTTESLVKWGANFRPVTLQGEWWRLVTNCFLHIGIFHLLFNMYALVYIGVLLEPYLGRLRFTAAYLLTGIIASITSLYWHDMTVSAGASGAIFGMYGVFLAMLTTNFIEKAARKTQLTSIAVFVVYNLANGMKGGIDNAAHIGGLLSGIVIGYAYYPSLKSPGNDNLKLGITGALTIFMLVISVVVYKRTPNDIGEYDTKIKSFVTWESRALEVFQMPKNSPKDSLLYAVKENGIYNWNKGITLIDSLDKLQLPDAIHERDRELIHYCNTRIKIYNLIYKAINENTDKYKDSIGVYSNNISAIIDSLKGK